MQTLEVCGYNANYGINEISNKKSGTIPFIYPPLNVNFDVSSIASYSAYNEKTVLITEEGKAYAIGSNSRGQISFSLPPQVYDHFTQIEMNDSDGYPLKFLSAVCGYYYTLFLVTGHDKNRPNRLFYSHTRIDDEETVYFDTNGHNPVSLFGGANQCAAVDDDGGIFYVHDSINESSNKNLERVLLPDGEKATSVACCVDFVVSLSLSGRVFYSKSCRKLSFCEVSELRGREIASVSGLSNFCFAVCKDGRVFVIGDNYYGQLGLGSKIEFVKKFTEISALRKFKIVKAYAGSYHSLFQTAEGSVLACGYNNYGQFMCKSGPCEVYAYSPIMTDIEEPSFICPGRFTTSVFKNHVPKRGPNIRVDFDNL